MSAPKRIQRKRTRGWRMPEGAVYVGRPTLYGNPFPIREEYVYIYRGDGGWQAVEVLDRQAAVAIFRDWITSRDGLRTYGREHHHLRELLPSLRGHDLACWCPLEDERGDRFPCHADVLLAIANGDQP